MNPGYIRKSVLGDDANTTQIQQRTNTRCVLKNLVKNYGGEKIKSVHKIYTKKTKLK